MEMYNNICHIEFEVKDLDLSKSFYEGLFGWNFAEFPIPGMKIFGFEDKHIGGLMQSDNPKPGNSPSLWFKVQDLDAMTAKAQELGGSVVAARSEVPHVGWSACIGDLDGNPVGMVQYSEEG